MGREGRDWWRGEGDTGRVIIAGEGAAPGLVDAGGLNYRAVCSVRTLHPYHKQIYTRVLEMEIQVKKFKSLFIDKL